MLAKWKIYYTDRSTLTNKQVGRPRDIPVEKRVGIHHVAQSIEEGRVRDVMVGAAFYAFLKTPRAWTQMEQNDVDDYEANLPGEIVVLLQGRIQPTEDYQRILVDARFDREIVGRVDDPNRPTRDYEE